MRLDDRSDRSIKALLILGLLIANIAVALSHRRPDSTKSLSAGIRVEMPRAAREAPPLPASPQD